MDFSQKTVGVWGLGVSGMAIIRFLLSQKNKGDFNICALEKNTVPNLPFFTQNMVRIYADPGQRDEFLATCDIIIPSPGVDLRPFPEVAHKCISEIDLFYEYWGKPIFAITGTLGKTSITHLLSSILSQAGKKIATGGNIGVGMLDLILHEKDADATVLELSSFQLDHAQKVAPDLAIWTNLFENHLDRHGSMAEYARAKMNVFAHQNNSQKTLLPLEIAPIIRADERFKDRPFAWFAMHKALPEQQKCILENDILYQTTKDGFERHTKKQQVLFFLNKHIPKISFVQNWLVLAAACDLLGYDAQAVISKAAPQVKIPDNRLQCVAQINGVDYFNDSKSTIMQATIAATNALRGKKIILLLGGVSKGVDRTPYLADLTHVFHVICFGKEAQLLADACALQNIPVSQCQTLESAVEVAQPLALPGTCVLLSPGGASFDLFRNYEERGKRFVQLVTEKQS